jgi:hypothetical protein
MKLKATTLSLPSYDAGKIEMLIAITAADLPLSLSLSVSGVADTGRMNNSAFRLHMGVGAASILRSQ